MRDRGFSFSATNKSDTVSIKVQVHWNRDETLTEVTDVITTAYAEAFHRATEAME